MKAKSLMQAKDRDLVNSFAAMRRATRVAREQAARAGIGIVVIQEGKVSRVTAEELHSQISKKRD